MNPDPATDTAEPTGPCPGDTVIPTVVPTKVADAVSGTPAWPVAVTAFEAPVALNAKWFPELAAKEQEPAPEEAVTVQSAGEVGPLKVTVVSLEAKPDIEAVTETPLGPWAGVRVKVVTVPVNVAEAASLAWDPAALTAFLVPDPLLKEKPYVESGENVHVPPPDPTGDTDTVHRGAPVGPVRATWVSVDANPDTLAATRTPLGPAEGFNVRFVTVPVNVAL